MIDAFITFYNAMILLCLPSAIIYVIACFLERW